MTSVELISDEKLFCRFITIQVGRKLKCGGKDGVIEHDRTDSMSLVRGAEVVELD